MCVAPEAGGNKVFVYLRLFGKAKEAFPDFAAFLLPEQPAPKFTAGKFVLADAVALNQASVISSGTRGLSLFTPTSVR